MSILEITKCINELNTVVDNINEYVDQIDILDKKRKLLEVDYEFKNKKIKQLKKTFRDEQKEITNRKNLALLKEKHEKFPEHLSSFKDKMIPLDNKVNILECAIKDNLNLFENVGNMTKNDYLKTKSNLERELSNVKIERDLIVSKFKDVCIHENHRNNILLRCDALDTYSYDVKRSCSKCNKLFNTCIHCKTIPRTECCYRCVSQKKLIVSV